VGFETVYDGYDGFGNPREDCVPAEPLAKRGKKLFKAASNVINGARQDQYGNPEDSFGLVAVRWSQYLHRRHGMEAVLSASDIAFMMADFKMARECNSHKRDNAVDIVGYLGMQDDIEGNK